MRKFLLPSLLAVAVAIVVPASVHAAGASKSSTSSGPNLYRYRNAQGVLVMESSIPPEYAAKGYQILSSTGQVIQDVPAVKVVSEDERKAKLESDAMSNRRDAELRKLYSAPQDAERLRDRQIEALKLKSEQARGQLNQTISRRKAEVEQAARMERAGGTVPPAMREGIERLNRQVTDLEVQIKAQEAEQARLRAEFDPVIERLKVIYPAKVVPGAPAATPAPAAASGAAVTPAANAAAVAATAKAAADKAAADKAAADKAAAEKAAAAKAAADKAAADKAAADKAALAAKVAADKAAADKAAAERAAAAKAAQDKAIAEKAAADKAAADKAAAAKAAAAKAAADKAAAEKAVAAKAAADKAAADKVVAEKAAAEKAKPKKLEDEQRSAGGLRPTGF